MTREEEIINKGIEYTMNHHPMCIGGGAFADAMREFNRNAAFEAGAKWADEHPNRNLVYTKQDLRAMGFGFDLNGNIVTLDEMDEMVKRGNEYRKSKLIEKACEWLSKTLYIHKEEIEDKHWNMTETFDWVTSDYDSVSDFIDAFKKAMEE